jgi:hypothetical protein
LKQLFTQLATATALAVAATLPTVAAATQAGTSADELLHDANDALQQIDAAHYQAVWDSAAPFLKAKIDKGQFVADIQKTRQSLGMIKTRDWSSVTRLQYAGAGGIPDGLYANVDFSTALSDGRVVFELLSFQLESPRRFQRSRDSLSST